MSIELCSNNHNNQCASPSSKGSDHGSNSDGVIDMTTTSRDAILWHTHPDDNCSRSSFSSSKGGGSGGGVDGDGHPSNGSSNNNNGEKLSVVMLATIVFYSVSGGPFGVEASVRAGGNFYTLLAFIVMPFVWSIPEAVMTAELGSTFPEAAGGVAWVEEAFGHGAGWMAGFLGWVAGATDNSIYPVLFLDYLLQLRGVGTENDVDSSISSSSGPDLHPIARFLFLSTTTLLLAYINWLGLMVVGRMSVVICFIAMSPFMILTLVGAFSVDPSRWFQRPSLEEVAMVVAVTDDDIDGGFFPYAVAAGVMWRPFLNNLFWNLNSFDSAASFSEDVDDPGRIFPVAMTWSVIMVVTGYLLPLTVALGASSAAQHEWVDGYFATVASQVVGPWLGAWTVFAAGISNIALFQAELSTESFQLMGMAERGYVPRIFAERSRHGTPTYGILLGTAVIVIMSASDLAQLIEMLNFNYAISLLMEYAAFIKLRITRPALHRPWRLPFSTLGCILLFTPTFVFTITLMSLATYTTYAFSMAVNLCGLGLFVAKKRGLFGDAAVSEKGPYSLVQRMDPAVTDEVFVDGAVVEAEAEMSDAIIDDVNGRQATDTG